MAGAHNLDAVNNVILRERFDLGLTLFATEGSEPMGGQRVEPL
ncbi:MAG: hypothetical protein NTU47_12270 [Ignavibacteriales bacterium]|nr:hypothetical protein [Ignavibacteriales bacterium]